MSPASPTSTPAEGDLFRPPEAQNAAFRPRTLEFLAERPASARKRLGQYFTPRAVRQRLLDKVTLRAGMKVLDPGVGTGEFLLDVLERRPDAEVHGCEIDPELLALCRGALPNRSLELKDFLRSETAGDFDLVIGNPPYYELKGAAGGQLDLEARYANVVSGRANVFAMFFAAGLASLKEGGRLAFVVPPSMNNGAYFDALRRYILAHASIEHLEVLRGSDLFDGAQQSVMLLVLKKGGHSDRHVFHAELGRRAEVPLFLEDPGALAKLLDGHATLAELGCDIRTGRCVWNQKKELLRREPGEGAAPLIWAHNVGAAGALEWQPDHPKRPQYVVEASPDVGPAVVVNRITGTVKTGALRAALVPPGVRFVAENHVNVVRIRQPLLGKGAIALEAIAAGLRSPRAAEALRLLTGNTQLSKTELEHLIPVVPRPRG